MPRQLDLGPEPPEYTAKCPHCGCKRTDPLADQCPACGEFYAYDPGGGDPYGAHCTGRGSAKGCGRPIVWVTMASGKKMPCNPLVLQVVTDGGQVVRGRISHYATCPHAGSHRKTE